VDWDAALLVVEDRDELESRAKFFVVLAVVTWRLPSSRAHNPRV